MIALCGLGLGRWVLCVPEHRWPCALCGSSRDCDRPAWELFRRIDGEALAVCESCLRGSAQEKGRRVAHLWGQLEPLLAENWEGKTRVRQILHESWESSRFGGPPTGAVDALLAVASLRGAVGGYVVSGIPGGEALVFSGLGEREVLRAWFLDRRSRKIRVGVLGRRRLGELVRSGPAWLLDGLAVLESDPGLGVGGGWW